VNYVVQLETVFKGLPSTGVLGLAAMPDRMRLSKVLQLPGHGLG